VHDNPKHWKKWLGLAKFWYNLIHHVSLGCSPFRALYNYDPNFGGMPNLSVTHESEAIDTDLDYQAHTELLRAQLWIAQLLQHFADHNRTER
jgi:hypothetical protein